MIFSILAAEKAVSYHAFFTRFSKMKVSKYNEKASLINWKGETNEKF